MATGSGKTYTAANVAYRLVRYGGAKRILFLVDRANLGRQTLNEFQTFTVPNDGRKFTELYNVQHMSSNAIDPVARVTISTIQRLYSTLKGEAELDEELDEESAYEALPDEPVSVAYNPKVPPETFDVDHRRRVPPLDLRALAPGARLLRRLHDRPHRDAEQAGARLLQPEPRDGVRPRARRSPTRSTSTSTSTGSATEITRARQQRSTRASSPASATAQTREVRWEKLDDEVSYGAEALDRAVVAEDQIRTVIETFRKRLFTEIFPGRTDVPEDADLRQGRLARRRHPPHRPRGVRQGRRVRGEDHLQVDGAQGRTSCSRSFRNSYYPRIAVTVDMIATGTDVKPLECVFFMRAVKSRTYFEQMKGRGVRVIDPNDLQGVTPDATAKDRFVIVDAVGVTESDLSETVPLDRKPTVPLDKLFKRISYGNRDPEVLSTIAGRLARLDRRLTRTTATSSKALAGH